MIDNWEIDVWWVLVYLLTTEQKRIQLVILQMYPVRKSNSQMDCWKENLTVFLDFGQDNYDCKKNEK